MSSVKINDTEEKEEEKEEENEEIIITYQTNRKESEIKEVEITEESLKIVFVGDRISECDNGDDNNNDDDDINNEVSIVKIHFCIPYQRQQQNPYVCKVKEKVGLFIRCICRATAKIKNTPFGNFLCTCFCTCNNAGDTTDSEINPNIPAPESTSCNSL